MDMPDRTRNSAILAGGESGCSRAIEIAAENDGAQFKRAFLVRKDKAHNAPEDLIFAERCREDRGRVATVSEAGSEVRSASPISKSRCR